MGTHCSPRNNPCYSNAKGITVARFIASDVRARADIVMTRTAANVEKISTAAGAIAARRLGELSYGLDVHQWHVWAVCPALGIVWSLREVGSERVTFTMKSR